MTANEFRELAMTFADVIEGEHMRHPDFCANGKIFATLGYPDASFGMVKLTPQDQAHMVEHHPHVFVPVKGAWGLQGSTSVRLASATPDLLAHALELAWRISAVALKTKPRKLTRQIGNEKSV
jgi:hypothetical protein